jgi:hypothetical protein
MHITSQPLYPRKEAQYEVYKRLGGPQGQPGHVWKISSHVGLGPWTRGKSFGIMYVIKYV